MRVVAGSLRSRALRAPKGSATRPTSDRVRESLFAVLGDVRDARVLDLYAGSGALAIEALSRGASSAVCVEASRAAASVIAENRDALGLGDRLTLVSRRVSSALETLAGPFDLVLADPPWANLAEAARDLAAVDKVIADEGLLVLEHSARDAPPQIAGLSVEETRRWGDTAATFYRKSAEPR